jgi:hypothetical protein
LLHNEEWFSTRIYNGDIAFLIYTLELHKTTFNTNHNNNTKRVLFADDTSVIVNNPSLINSERDVYMVFKNMNVWFSGNLLSINFGKTLFTKK